MICLLPAGHRTVQQRSEFATSDYKKPLQLAVDFRNEFAVRPFLCRELIDASCLEVGFVLQISY